MPAILESGGAKRRNSLQRSLYSTCRNAIMYFVLMSHDQIKYSTTKGSCTRPPPRPPPPRGCWRRRRWTRSGGRCGSCRLSCSTLTSGRCMRNGLHRTKFSSTLTWERCKRNGLQTVEITSLVWKYLTNLESSNLGI